MNERRINSTPLAVQFPRSAPKAAFQRLLDFFFRDPVAMGENPFNHERRRFQQRKLFGKRALAEIEINKVGLVGRQECFLPKQILETSRSYVAGNYEFAFIESYGIRGMVHEIHRYNKFTRCWLGGTPMFEFYPLVKLRLHQLSLMFNGLERPISRTHATPADYHQEKREDGSSRCSPSPELVIEVLACTCILCIGGICLSLWVLFNVNEDRRVLCTSLEYLGLGAFTVGWWLWWSGLFLGLPQGWPPCYPFGEGDDHQQDKNPHAQTVTQKVLTCANFSHYNNYMANVLGSDKQIGIIGALCEGSSIRSIERVTGVHRDTIMRLGVKVGQGCTALMDAKMRNLSCTRLECDEIWGYVGKKERHLRADDDPQFGNVWTYLRD
jgi:hypothetical protein